MSGELLSFSCCNFVIYLQIHVTQISDLIEGHYLIWQLSFVTSCQVVYHINTAHSGDYPPYGTYHKNCVYMYHYSHQLFGDGNSGFLHTDREQSITANYVSSILISPPNSLLGDKFLGDYPTQIQHYF
jgi:hypothetical protein